MAAQQAARDKEREEKKAKAAAEGGPASGAAEASKSEGAWVRKGPLPPSQQRHNSRDSNKQQQQPAAAKDLPPPVPTVGEPAASATPAAQRKEGFSYSKAAGKSDGGVDAVTQGVEQAKLE
jgi:hypothetical protein